MLPGTIGSGAATPANPAIAAIKIERFLIGADALERERAAVAAFARLQQSFTQALSLKARADIKMVDKGMRFPDRRETDNVSAHLGDMNDLSLDASGKFGAIQRPLLETSGRQPSRVEYFEQARVFFLNR